MKIKKIIAHSLDKNTIKRSLIIALIVGTILNLINQGRDILALDFDYLKAILTYCVPYLVSSLSSTLQAYQTDNALNESAASKAQPKSTEFPLLAKVVQRRNNTIAQILSEQNEVLSQLSESVDNNNTQAIEAVSTLDGLHKQLNTLLAVNKPASESE